MASQDELLTRHHEALQRLARSPALRGGRRAALLEACTVAAEVLEVERVSVWLYGAGRASIRCETLTARTTGQAPSGLELSRDDYPAYFRALEQERTIAAEDAHADPQTAEFSSSYLTPLGIGAMLDAPILVAGECVGVVCHEHVGGARRWQPSEKLFAGSIADFVALSLQADELAQRRDELEEALEAASMGAWSWDLNADRVRWNERVGPLFGKPAGWSPADQAAFLELVHPEDRNMVETAMARALAPGGDGYLVQFRLRLDDGDFRWVEGRGRVHRDESGKPARISGTIMDVTERRKLEEQLLQAQKMEAVGRLAGGVAHDFNNLLTAISGTADLMRMDAEPGSEVAQDLEQILLATGRGGALTQQLLTFARQQQTAPIAVDVDQLLRGLHGLLRRVIGEDVELVIEPADVAPVTTIDPGQLEQVLLNLVVNARDAMPDGGRLVVSAHVARERPEVVLRVQDTGVGMSDALIQRAFEPFFTTKERGQGTGLGLATCYGIVEQAGGSMRIDSTVGEGTTVSVILPLADETVGQERPPVSDAVARGGDETVLLVEDEPVVRKLAVRALSHHGYNVICASNAAEAADMAQARGQPVDLLLTDVVMPNGSGATLAAQLREQGLVGRVLLMSGYAFDHVEAEMPDGTYFLAKPFAARDLAARVREVLDAE